MQFGVLLPQFGPAARSQVAARLRETALAAERLGYDVLWTAEHVIFPAKVETPYPYGGSFPYAVDDPILDVIATLAYVAALTARIKLGSAVIVLPLHNPVILAKQIASLDVLSGGRVLLGVAGGWLREEFEMVGVPFRQRGRRTDEFITALRALWTQERVTFRGEWVQLKDAAMFPKPAHRSPPIWIGGGSTAALRRVARLGDGWIAVPHKRLEDLAAQIAAIRQAAEAAGRDPAQIGVASSGAARSLDELLERLPALAAMGVTVATVPALFWARSFEHSLELLHEFAQRAGLPARAA